MARHVEAGGTSSYATGKPVVGHQLSPDPGLATLPIAKMLGTVF